MAIAAIKGFTRGLLSELGGAVAVILALAVPLYYNGMLDPTVEKTLHMKAGAAHIAGMVLAGLIVYIAAMLVLWVLSRFTSLPGLGTGNALAGGVIGLAKGAILLWFVLFIALLFPLSASMRAELHESYLATILAQQNKRVDAAIYGRLPDFAKPIAKQLLARQQF